MCSLALLLSKSARALVRAFACAFEWSVHVAYATVRPFVATALPLVADAAAAAAAAATAAQSSCGGEL